MIVPKPARVSALVLLIASLHAWSAETKDKPSFQVDLKQFGYVADAAEYSTLGFLSNDLLLVVVNQRVVYRVQALTTDSPGSTFVVFDVAKKQMLRSAQMTVTNAARSVAVLTTGDFLVASMDDVKLCSSDLRCDKSFPSHGGPPIDLNKARTMTEMDATIRSDDSSVDGTRSVTAELSSTTWNTVTHPLGGIDEPTRPNFRRVTVYDNKSQKTLISLHYDPKGHLVGPALSPDGTKLAVVREGRLEIFDVP